ncbi:MAG: cob(I)yrinic acid a,c-diamide adenosyltransferase [Candidatus Limiplasma sp.]|nr:cob(I)yrinic acid a,c-diamide adenosyltransferase [Candidatus Limiplasma sp.]MEA5145748.1 cob(I)yrinic acid a,c-diamide adenosyltransferase [Candidatus Limiplasma sp.]
MAARGMIHVYYGDGKGKSTAAIGLAVRALGQGMRVCLLQFWKGTPTGECLLLEGIQGLRILRGQNNGKSFAAMSEAERSAMLACHQTMLAQALAWVRQGELDMLVLDEVLDAILLSMVDEQALQALLQDKPTSLELVITGHQPVPWVMAYADYITHMVKERHPFDRGQIARRGIEF